MRRLPIIAGLLLSACGSASALAQMMPHMGMHGMMRRTPQAAPAKAPAALQDHACMACHEVRQGSTGPAFAWVAWRYRGQANAEDALTAFIEHGGPGHWPGNMPDLNVPPADARDIARWILSLPPEAPPASDDGR